MKLDKHQARAFIRENSNHSKGDYNPSKYVLEGWVMETPEAVLRALIIKAYADKLAARKASQERSEAWSRHRQSYRSAPRLSAIPKMGA